jgi:hypothetical protein
MSAFTDIRDSVTGYDSRKKKWDTKKTTGNVLGAAAIFGTKEGREAMFGKEGGFDRYNVDPNFNTYREGLARTTKALEDPNRNPYFQAAMKKAGRFHPGGGRDRAFAMASLAGAGASNAAYGRAYDQSRPIIANRQPTGGALPGLTDAYARFMGAKEGAKSAGVQDQGGGFDMNSFMQMMFKNPAAMNWFKQNYQGDSEPQLT